MIAFMMKNVDAAIEFYERCIYKEAITEVERIEIMTEMIHEGKVTAYGAENLSKEDFVKEMSKFCNVHVVTKKAKESGSPKD